jgi:hypothetical protein
MSYDLVGFMNTKEQQMSFALAATTHSLVVDKSMDVVESTCSCESIHWRQFPYVFYYLRVLKVCTFANVIDYTYVILFVHPS